MFAVDHAATALLVRRRYPRVPLVRLLVAVQAMELAWVVLNYAGVERTVVDARVNSVADIHLVLDLITHARDIAVAPGVGVMLGAGLYDRAPIGAFFVELVYGLCCWWVYVRDRTRRTAWRGLLAFVAVGNLLNLSFLAPDIHGPEALLAGRPLLLVTVILVQIIVTL